MEFQQPRPPRQAGPRPSTNPSTNVGAQVPTPTHTLKNIEKGKSIAESNNDGWIIFSHDDVVSWDNTDPIVTPSDITGLGSFGPAIPVNGGSEGEDESKDGESRNKNAGQSVASDIQEHPPSSSEHDTADLDSLDHRLADFNNPTHPFTLRSPVNLRARGKLFETNPTLFSSLGFSQSQMQEHINLLDNRNIGSVPRSGSIAQSLQTLEQPDPLSAQEERYQRIEKWRLEQSRCLLEEIEKKTQLLRKQTQRRNSISSSAGATSSQFSPGATRPSPDSPDQAEGAVNDPSDDTFSWRLFTHKVIQNVMGIDESILDIIFGETLPESAFEGGSYPPLRDGAEIDSSLGSSWEERVLSRIARELGHLVSRLSSEQPEHAFSTYPLQTAQIPTERTTDRSTTNHGYKHPIKHKSVPSTPKPHSVSFGSPIHQSASSDMLFSPTVQQRHCAVAERDSSFWGVEDHDLDSKIGRKEDLDQTQRGSSDGNVAYWEQDLSVAKVIGFFCKRFSSRPASPSRDNSTSTTSSKGSLEIEPTSGLKRPNVSFSMGSPSQARKAKLSSVPLVSATITPNFDHPNTAGRRAYIRANHPLSSHSPAEASRNASPERKQTSSLKAHTIPTPPHRVTGNLTEGTDAQFALPSSRHTFFSPRSERQVYPAPPASSCASESNQSGVPASTQGSQHRRAVSVPFEFIGTGNTDISSPASSMVSPHSPFWGFGFGGGGGEGGLVT